MIATLAPAIMAVLLVLGWTPRLERRSRWVPPRSALLVLVALAIGMLHGATLVLAGIAALAGAGGWWLHTRARTRAAADRRRLAVVEACEAVAAELRSGRPPAVAVESGARVWPELAPVVGAARLGADLPAAFRSVAVRPGAGALAEVAAAWQLSHATGSGLALALDRVADTARAELATHRVVTAELASALATARMIAVLPLVMLVLSQGSGAEPWRFLLGTGPGLGCLAGGVVLTMAGLAWIERIVVRVEADGP